MVTYDGEDECVGEVSVERKLHHVPPQPQQLHGLGQTHKDVRQPSRKDNSSRSSLAEAWQAPPTAPNHAHPPLRNIITCFLDINSQQL